MYPFPSKSIKKTYSKEILMELLGLFFLGIPVSLIALYILFTNQDNTNANRKDNRPEEHPYGR